MDGSLEGLLEGPTQRLGSFEGLLEAACAFCRQF